MDSERSGWRRIIEAGTLLGVVLAVVFWRWPYGGHSNSNEAVSGPLVSSTGTSLPKVESSTPSTSPDPTPSPSSTSRSSPKTKTSFDEQTAVVTHLANLDTYNGGWDDNGADGGDAAIAGRIYPYSENATDCFGDSGPTEVEYDIGHKYIRFRTAVGMADGTDRTWKSRVNIYAGGHLVRSLLVQRGRVYHLDFSVRHTSTLRFVISTLGGNAGCGSLAPEGPTLGDPRLFGNSG
jgi:hypothetical protein